MAISLKSLIFYFSGQDVNEKKRQKDLAEYIENLNFAVDSQTYIDKDQKLPAIQVIFQTHLQDKVFFLYQGLSSETRASWQLLKTAFFS